MKITIEIEVYYPEDTKMVAEAVINECQALLNVQPDTATTERRVKYKSDRDSNEYTASSKLTIYNR